MAYASPFTPGPNHGSWASHHRPLALSTPAWQTDELAEEWPEEAEPELNSPLDESRMGGTGTSKEREVENRYGSIKWMGSTKAGASNGVRLGQDIEVYDQDRPESRLTEHQYPVPVSPKVASGAKGEPHDIDSMGSGKASLIRFDTLSLDANPKRAAQLGDPDADAGDDVYLSALDVPSRQPSSNGSMNTNKSSKPQQRTPITKIDSGTYLSSPNAGRSIRQRVFSVDTSENEKISNGYLASQIVPSPPASDSESAKRSPVLEDPHQSPSSDDVPIGTFIVKEDQPAGQALLRRSNGSDEDENTAAFLKPLRNPFAGGQAAEFGAPLALERMFNPPTPPEKISSSEDQGVEPAGDRQAPSAGPSAGSWGRSTIRGSGLYDSMRRPTSQMTASAQSTAKQDSGTLRISGKPVSPRRMSHNYMPRKPSRLSESLSPPSLHSSTSETSARGVDADDEESPSPNPESSTSPQMAPSPFSGPPSANRSHQNQPIRRFSGQPKSMEDVDFTFASPSLPSMSPPKNWLPQPAPSTPQSHSRFGLFQIHPDTFTKSHVGKLVDALRVNGTPVRMLASRRRSERRQSGRGGVGSREGTLRGRPGANNALNDPQEQLSVDRYRKDHGLRSQENDDQDSNEGSSRSSKRIRLSGESLASNARDLRDRQQDGAYSSSSISASRFPTPPPRAEVPKPSGANWGQRGQDLLSKIRDQPLFTSPSMTSASDGEREHSQQYERVTHPPDFRPDNPTREPQTAHAPPQGTVSSGTATITGHYAASGQSILDRIKDRRVSDSSGVGTGPDDFGNQNRGPSPTNGRANLMSQDPNSARNASSNDLEQEGVDLRNVDVSSLLHGGNHSQMKLAVESPSGRVSAEPPQPTAHGRARNVRHIAPTMLGQIPDQVGRMFFDRSQMRWVKAVSGSSQAAAPNAISTEHSSNDSDDVFAGLDSLKDSRIEQNQPSGSRSPKNDPTLSTIASRRDEVEVDFEHTGMLSANRGTSANQFGPTSSTPERAQKDGMAPVSALKKRSSNQTPALVKSEIEPTSSAKRSVSFSDGRKAGKMKDLRWAGPQNAQRTSYKLEVQLEEAESSEEDGDDIATPSKRISRSSSGALDAPVSASESLHASPLHPPRNTVKHDRTFPEDPLDFVPRLSARRQAGDATFLTECSFTVAHDKLVELITEAQPFEPHWDRLTEIDLSKKGATSVARMKEFLPNLDEANLNDNEIAYLSGIPKTIRKLFVARNLLSSLTAVNHLSNLQYLDISRNALESVNQLNCLKHLRELKLDYNRVKDIQDIMEIDSLVKISCKGNEMTTLDLRDSKWARLEVLDVACNRIDTVTGLESLTTLHTFNIEKNELTQLVPARPMRSLRILRASHNKLTTFDLSITPRLKTLYADCNQLAEVGLGDLKHAKSLDFNRLRDLARLYISGNQLSKGFFPSTPLYGISYLEAAACQLQEWPESFDKVFISARYINLNYNFIPDFSGLRGITGLKKLTMVGNRLGHSGLTDVIRDLKAFSGLTELDIRYVDPIVAPSHKAHPDLLKLVHGRMNPCTMHLYLPIVAPVRPANAEQVPTADATSDWPLLDVQYRQGLPDDWYCKRMAYRALVAMACPSMARLDTLVILDAELKKGRMLLEGAIEA